MQKAWRSWCRQDRRGGSDAAEQQQASDSRRADLERQLAGANRDSMSWEDEVCLSEASSRYTPHPDE